MQPQLLNPKDFQTIIEGVETDLITLQNKNGITVQITNYGARVVSCWTPDKQGNFEDIVLGYSKLSDYLKKTNYYGAAIGRYSNRIAHSSFELDGEHYKLLDNERGSNLHGGARGFHNVPWRIIDKGTQHVELEYLSEDGEENFPGNLKVNITYSLTSEDELRIEYKATTDKATPINVTNHSYFNLLGAGNGRIEHHHLQINASHFLPGNDVLVPTGELKSVENTPFDLRKRKELKESIESEDEQLELGVGFDHTFVLDTKEDFHFEAAEVYEPNTGRVLRVYTNEPGIQFYSGNFSDDSIEGKWGKHYRSRGALCLETQHFPNSPNQPNFPNTILRPNEEFYSICVYQFEIE